MDNVITNLTGHSNFTEISIPRIDDLQRVITGICYFVASVLGITGNSLVILSVCASKTLWSTNNVFVVNLSVADIMTSISILGSVIVTLSPVSVEYPIPDLLCAAASAGVSTTFGCSVYTLASIAINRLDGVTRPLETYNVNYTICMSLWIFVIWLIPFLATILPPIFDIGRLGTNSYLRTCSTDFYHPRLVLQGKIQVLVFYPLPLAIIFICYMAIFIYLIRHTYSMKAAYRDSAENAVALVTSMRKRQIAVTKNMFYVLAVFLLLLTPYGLWVFLGLNFGSIILYVSTLVVFNSCVNPFLYGLGHPTFKRVFKCLLSGRWIDVPQPTDAFNKLRKSFSRS